MLLGKMFDFAYILLLVKLFAAIGILTAVGVSGDDLGTMGCGTLGSNDIDPGSRERGAVHLATKCSRRQTRCGR